MCRNLGIIITKVITLVAGIYFGYFFYRSAYILTLILTPFSEYFGPNEYLTNRVFTAGVVFFTGVLILLSDKFEKFWEFEEFWEKDKED